jgi:uncharacterized protein (TIGR00369 family)
LTIPEVDLDAVRAGWQATRSEYARLLRIELEQLESGRATMRMKTVFGVLNEGGAVHGGAIVSLCDTAFHVAHLSLYGLGAPGVTVDVNCAFLSAAFPPHDLIALAEVMKGGRRLVYGQVSVYSNERRVAHCTLNFMNPDADRR